MTQTSIALWIFVVLIVAVLAIRFALRRGRGQALLLTTQLPTQEGQAAAPLGANLQSPGPSFTLYLCNFGGRRRVVSHLLFRYDQGRQLQLGALTVGGGHLGVAMNARPISLQARAIHPFACPWSAVSAGFAGIVVELEDGASYRLADAEVAQLKAIAESRQAPFGAPQNPALAR